MLRNNVTWQPLTSLRTSATDLLMRSRTSICACALAAVFGASAAHADRRVELQGVFSGRALLSIDGGSPRTLAAGASASGVTVVSVSSDSAVLEVDGKRLTVRLGENTRFVNSTSGEAAAEGQGRAVLQSDGRGHFVAQGLINGAFVTMLVDTGASLTVLPAHEARRLGIDYRRIGTAGMAHTANGPVQTWNLSLNSVRVQGITLHNVPAAVIEAPLATILLGNSFLNRVQMQREGERMILVRRF